MLGIDIETKVRELLGGAVGRELMAKVTAEREQSRLAAADDLARARADRAKVRPALDEALQQAETDLKKAQAALDEARRQYRAVSREHMTRLGEWHRAESAAEVRCRANAPECIAEFCAWAEARERKIVGNYVAMPKAYAFGGVPLPAEDPQLQAQRAAWERMDAQRRALREARAEAEALVFSDLSDADIDAKFQAMRKKLTAQ